MEGGKAVSPNVRQQKPWESVGERRTVATLMLTENEALSERDRHLYSVCQLALCFLLLFLISTSVFAFVSLLSAYALFIC